jgi:hypothetical protein
MNSKRMNKIKLFSLILILSVMISTPLFAQDALASNTGINANASSFTVTVELKKKSELQFWLLK